MKYVKAAGVVGSIASTGYSGLKVYNQYDEGGFDEVLEHRDFVDAGVGVIGLGTTGLVALGLVSNTVGWAIGIGILAYGDATLVYDAYNEETVKN